MSDELRRIYAQEGKLHNFFEISVPTDLFRGRKEGSSSPYLLPTLVGWPKRQPDVLLLDAEGGSPQFEGGSVTGEMITEDRKTTPRTAEIMAAAASYTVKGCRTTYQASIEESRHSTGQTRPCATFSGFDFRKVCRFLRGSP
jgi:hypothetical protein